MSAQMSPRRRGFGWAVILPLVLLAMTLGVSVMAARESEARRVAAERALRDYAAVAGTVFIQRAAFNLGFNGYQPIAVGLRRTAAQGKMGVAPYLEPRVKALVSRLYSVREGELQLLSGDPPADGVVAWLRSEVEALPQDPEPVSFRHRIVEGGAQTAVIVLVSEAPRRLAAFEVNLAAMLPFLQSSLDSGPLLPEVVGDGHAGNSSLTLTYRDPAGRERLRTGPPHPTGFEADFPFGDYYRGVLEGSRVSVVLDPAIADRLVPGGLPQSLRPFLGLLVLGALGLTGLSVVQFRRERAFSRLREDFVVSVSHELRTPLAQIRLFTESVLLGRCRSREEEKRFLEAAARETLRLGHMVENILGLSRSGGQLPLARETVAVAPLIDRIVEGFEPLAAGRKVRLTTNTDPAVEALANPDAIERILLNLLDNAVKYGPEGGEVGVRLRRADEGVELAVEDRGPGVPQASRQSIFMPFERLERDRRSSATGAGIGLAIVRDLVTAQGGACRVEDREGGGARFLVTLPLAEAPA